MPITVLLGWMHQEEGDGYGCIMGAYGFIHFRWQVCGVVIIRWKAQTTSLIFVLFQKCGAVFFSLSLSTL